MSKKWLLAITLGTALVSGQAFAEDKLRVGTEGAYAPYNYVNDEGKLAGFEIDLGNEICKRTNMTCEFIQNKWDSIIPNLLAGNYDAIMAGMSITDERKKSITFSDEYKPVDPSLYLVKKGTQLDFDKLEGKSIGIQGATIQDGFAKEKWGAKNTLKSYEKADQSLADVMAGTVDVVLADGEFVRTAVAGSNGELEIVGQKEMIGGGIGIGMRPDDTKLHEKINTALAEIKKDGTLETLTKKYFTEQK